MIMQEGCKEPFGKNIEKDFHQVSNFFNIQFVDCHKCWAELQSCLFCKLIHCLCNVVVFALWTCYINQENKYYRYIQEFFWYYGAKLMNQA